MHYSKHLRQWKTMEEVKIGIINVSDRASTGIYKDLPGKEIIHTLNEYLITPWKKVYRVVPDEQKSIEHTLVSFSDKENCCLILTSGGTGPAERDITPEATIVVCNKLLPGFGELMRRHSLKYIPTAILSRQIAGIRNKTLIINLPGKPRAIRQCLDVIFPAIPHCIDLIKGPYLRYNEEIIQTFETRQP